jgi:hypothetical protein
VATGARALIPEPSEQQAIADMVAMRNAGDSLMVIRDAIWAKAFAISHQSVANILARAS